jgi:hypothetical protein
MARDIYACNACAVLRRSDLAVGIRAVPVRRHALFGGHLLIMPLSAQASPQIAARFALAMAEVG